MTRTRTTPAVPAMRDAPAHVNASAAVVHPHTPVRWTRAMMQSHFDGMTAAERATIDPAQREAVRDAVRRDE